MSKSDAKGKDVYLLAVSTSEGAEKVAVREWSDRRGSLPLEQEGWLGACQSTGGVPAAGASTRGGSQSVPR